MSGTYVLLQFGADPWPTRFEDLEGRPAFTVTVVEQTPNLLLKLIREAPWAQQHPDIMGPSSSFFYFGPSRTPGYLVYGNSQTQSMANLRKQKKDHSPSRYFVAQNGREYKWKISPQRLECFDSKGVIIATWEIGQLEDTFHARLSIKHPGLPVVTEILTTLTLNRIAQVLNCLGYLHNLHRIIYHEWNRSVTILETSITGNSDALQSPSQYSNTAYRVFAFSSFFLSTVAIPELYYACKPQQFCRPQLRRLNRVCQAGPFWLVLKVPRPANERAQNAPRLELPLVPLHPWTEVPQDVYSFLDLPYAVPPLFHVCLSPLDNDPARSAAARGPGRCEGKTHAEE
ncbi:hypothetical protein NM688_g8914 [Phlebia brevispora]|uniref:Uncharacterized protein n=1 Tax=Phlebia brevispora TaxID=194682 RepID=A0ACC1RM02_9APHY|nr:hypothetical protein NM688_g8914 [Phlebia brevispora]